MKTESPTVIEVDNLTCFANCDIIVKYEPKLCRHAEFCARGLSEVFRSSIIPWIDLDKAPTDEIVRQIERCPSGALKYYRVNTTR